MVTKAKSAVKAESTDEWLAAHPEKRAKPRTIAPLPPAPLTNSEKDRAFVLGSLGHTHGEECPPGVHWVSNPATEKRQLLFCNHTLPAVTFDDFRGFAPCGWIWCHRKDLVNPAQWADLRAAIESLKSASIDVDAPELVEMARAFAESADWRWMWPDQYKAIAAALDVPALRFALEASPTGLQLIKQVELAREAASPREGGGNAKNVPMMKFLAEAKTREWSPAIAAAILTLYGITQDRFSTLKNRLSVYLCERIED